MELCYSDKQALLRRFPDFELSYATVTHKKVPDNYNLGIAISAGKKYFAWFTFQKDKNVCYLMELNKERKIVRVFESHCVFDAQLSLGTILYGTICDNSSPTKFVFSVEDVYYYKGNSLKCPFNFKIGILKSIFAQHLTDTFELPKPALLSPEHIQVVFTLPCMWTLTSESDKSDILPSHIHSCIGYNTHHIQYRDIHNISPYLDVFPNTKPIAPVIIPAEIKRAMPERPVFMNFSKPQYSYPTVFQVCADIQFDIYHLYAFGKNKSAVYYNVAYIPNIKTSYMMNSLFRNIRENKNLDYIEESEDEDEFEDMREDKYVDLNKSINMECIFHTKFKKWIPIREIGTSEKVVHISKL
jgi:hypothetical protein